MTELGQRVVDAVRAALECEPEWTTDVDGGFVWWPSPLRQWVLEFEPDESCGPDAVGITVGRDMVRDIEDDQAGLAWVWTLNDSGPISPCLWDADRRTIGTEFHLIITPEDEAVMTRVACDAAALQIFDSSGPAFEIAEELGTEPNMTWGPNKEARIDISELPRSRTLEISESGKGPSAFTADHLAEFVVVAGSLDLEAHEEPGGVRLTFPSIASADDTSSDYVATVEFRNDTVDEYLGTGLLCEIRDSMPFAPFTGAAAANMLNLAENSSDTAITTLGAWSATGPDDRTQGDLVRFRLFLPNTVAAPGLVRELTQVFLKRVELAREVFQDLRDNSAADDLDDLGEIKDPEYERWLFAQECFFAPGAHPNEPTSQALNDADPRTSMLNAVLGVIQPEDWVVQTERGFWWLPFRLAHEFDIIETPAGDDEFFTTLRFRTVLVDEVEDPAAALVLANDLNRTTFGCSVWFDPDIAALCAGSAVRLDRDRPWMPRTFLINYMNCVGILERLALSAAPRVGGTARCVVHPELGEREVPDSLASEHLLQTENPVSAVGWRFSRDEIDRFAASWTRWFGEWGVNEPATGVVHSRDLATPQDALRLSASFDWGDTDVAMNCGLTRHPELGWGYQNVVSVLAEVGVDSGTEPIPTAVPHDVWVANVLNRLESNYPILPLVLGGWSGWGGQIHRSSFITAATAELLGAPNGEVARSLAWITADLFNPGGVGDLLEALPGIATTPADTSQWTSIAANQRVTPVLTLDADIFDRVRSGELVEDVRESPRFHGDLWSLPVSQAVASYGQLTGGPPYVAVLSTSVDPEDGTTVVVERRWAPDQTGAWVRGVVPADAPADALGQTIAATIERLDPHDVDWFLTEDHAMEQVLHSALRSAAERSPDGLLQRARHLMDTIGDPLKRLEWAQPPKYLAPLAGNGVDNWLHAVQLPKNIDGHVAAVPALWADALWINQGAPEKAAAALAQRRRTPGL